MAKASVQYLPQGRDGFVCVLITKASSELKTSGLAEDVEPLTEGSEALTANPAAVANLWAYGKQENLRRRARAAEKRKSHGSKAAEHADLAKGIAAMVDRLSDKRRQAWCSSCLSLTDHGRVAGMPGPPPAYLCLTCGCPTAPCAAPHCSNMAIRETRAAAVPRYCAEHRHDITGFAKLDQRIATLDDNAALLTYDKKNLAGPTRIVGGVLAGAAVIAPAALLAAPAVGGAIGASVLGGGLSGAAAVSHGLAILGGGSIAAGGLGMAGGTAVVTTVGGGVGGAMGALTTSAYFRHDKSFAIELLREGVGSPVLLANGFLTEGDNGWGPWEGIVTKRYPDAPVYLVRWGSKELKDLGSLATAGASKAAAAKLVTGMATRASMKAAAKIPQLGALLAANDLLANPWSVAKTRAAMTGAILADILARTDTERFILMGHSLGARVMVTAAQILGTRHDKPKLESIHLLGAAVSAKGDWRTLNDSVSDRVWNYHSTNDPILYWLYRYAQLGSPAAGSVGFKSKFAKITDRDVSRVVSTHSDYFAKVTLQ